MRRIYSALQLSPISPAEVKTLYENAFELKIVGNEVCYTAFSLLVT